MPEDTKVTVVSMGLTETDFANAEFITNELNLFNKANGVSWALSVARELIERSRHENTRVIIRDEKTGHQFDVKV